MRRVMLTRGRYRAARAAKNDIRDVGFTADLVLVFLVHLVHWYQLVPTGT